MIDRICSIVGCERAQRARSMCELHWRRWKKHGDPSVVLTIPTRIKGPGNCNWRGADIGYGAAHCRLRSHRGRARDYPCSRCGKSAVEWAYDHLDPNEKIGTTARGRPVRYSPDVSHYLPLCKRCHWRHDVIRAVLRDE